jgi:ubiquitin-like modifier-activating enzyme 5
MVCAAGINPDVIFEEYTVDITTTANFEQLLDRIQHGGVDGSSKIDLVLSCVDNYAARTALNQACNELNQVWMESGVSEDAVSGHIQLLLPGRTACFECLPPLIVASGIDESTLKREGVCAASLPTTMGLVAALLVQNTLKYLLGFGQVGYYLGYSAMKDFFPSDVMRPNPECSNAHCRKQQANPEHANWQPMVWKALGHDGTEGKAVEHSENEWGIELGGGDDAAGFGAAATEQPALASGLSFAYEQKAAAPVSSSVEQAAAPAGISDADVSLEDLMGQLKSL